MMRRRDSLPFVAVAIAAALLGPAGSAGAHDETAVDDGGAVHDEGHHQHGGADGHLAPVTDDVTLVGQLELSEVPELGAGVVADVGVHEGYAYLARFRTDACEGPEGGPADGGVWIVDVRDPANPTEVGFIPSHQDTFTGEGIQAIALTTPRFSGDILVTNSESCGKNSKGGLSIYDVTDPTRPQRLAENVGDLTAGGAGNRPHDASQIHSAFAWDAGDRAFAVMTDDDELADVDIVEITDPRHPRLIAEFDFDERFPQIVQPELGDAGSFLHDMVVDLIGGRWILLASYWDGGYVLADVTDPTNPTYIGDSDFTVPDPELLESAGLSELPEGNAHQAEFNLDRGRIVAADEDFDPYSTEITSDNGVTIDAGSGSDTPQLGAGEQIVGESVYVGRACPGDAAVPAGDGTQIAVVERGVCTFTEKVAAVEAAGGYTAVIIFNREGADGCNSTIGMLVDGGVPTFGVAPREQLFDLFGIPFDEAACLAGDGSALSGIAVGTAGPEITARSFFDGWGYVHLLENEAGKLTELDTFAIDEAHDEAFATGFGDLSVHEVAMSHERSDLAYLSYYSGGFRVLEIQGGELVEVGAYIDTEGNNLWGVQVFEHEGRELVAASDRDHGLFIFEYTPAP